MPNTFYSYDAEVISGSVIRADKYNSDQQSIETGFESVEDKFTRTIQLPAQFTGTPEIPEQTVTETFIYVNASGDLDLYPITTFLQQFEAVDDAYEQIDTWQQRISSDIVTAATSATTASEWAGQDEDTVVANSEFSAKHYAAKSSASAVSASGHSSDAGGHSSDASGHASDASASSDLANEFANKNANTFVSGTSLYSAKHWAAEAESYAQQTLETVSGDFVPSSRTVAGKPLSSNITIAVDDLTDSGSAAKEDAQTSATDTTAGALMAVGAFGLGADACPTLSDFAADNPAGLYTAVEDVVSNFPATNKSAFKLLILCTKESNGGNGSYYVQRLVASDDQHRSWSVSNVSGSVNVSEIWSEANLVKTTSNADSTAGSILQVGDFGLGSNAVLITNWNNATETGFYQSTLDNGQFHSPFNSLDGWVGLVVRLNFGNIAQQVWRAGANAIEVYTRFYSSVTTTWTDWAEHWTSANLVKTSSDDDSTAGRIMKTGDFGLGSVQSPRITDLDTALTGGLFGLNPTGLLNAPPDLTKFATLKVVAYGPTFVTQEIVERTTRCMWFRTLESGGVFSNWAEVYTSARPNINTQRANGSATIVAKGPYTDVTHNSAVASVLTIDETDFESTYVLVIKKVAAAGDLTVNTSTPIYAKDGTNATSLFFEAGFAGKAEFSFAGNGWNVRVS